MMAYIDGANLANDSNIRARVLQCARNEGIADPDNWVASNMGKLSVAPGWSDRWASAMTSRQYPIGADPAVISDADILSAVQALENTESGS